MKIKFNNRAKLAKQKGNHDYYDWEVFVDKENLESLDDIDHITYFLHKSFPNPIRTVEDPSSGFTVSSRGWGEFDIGVQIEYKDGNVETGVYPLDLSKPWILDDTT